MSAEELERQQMQGMRGLGDLTEPLKRERGEFVPSAAGRSPRTVPADLLPGARRALPPLNSSVVTSVQPVVANKVGFGAQSSYDTLPANGGRANYSSQVTIAESIIHTGLFTAEKVLTQIIPAGRVFFARQLRVNVVDLFDSLTELSFGIPPNFILISIARNSDIEVFNQAIGLAPLDGFIPISLWAGPGDKIEVIFTANYEDFAGSDINLSADLEVNLCGDMLVTNDKPYPYTGLSE